MGKLRGICALTILIVWPTLARSDEPDVQARELRKQIESIKEQLFKLEYAGSSSKGITQIGTSRRGNAREPAMVVRIYELSDLFTVAPAYEAQRFDELGPQSGSVFGQLNRQPTRSGMSGMEGGMGGGMFSVADSDANSMQGRSGALRTSLDDVVTAIRTSISPASWDETGGNGTIATVGNSLLISAEDSTHEQIEALIGLFRQRWGTLRTVSLRVYWLWLSDAQLADLIPGEQLFAQDERANEMVDDSAWKSLHEQMRAGKEGIAPGYRAAITCYNGQTVSVVSGEESNSITNFIPIVGRGGVGGPAPVAYQPLQTRIQDGVALQATPSVNTSGKIVILDIQSRVAQQIMGEASHPAVEPRDTESINPADLVAILEHPRMKVHRLATTLRIPVDRIMLVGGMTFSPKQAEGEKSLYLFVRATVQELRDDHFTSKLINQPAK